MARNDFGFGFKPIEEFTFDDCFVRIEQNRVDGIDSDADLLERYAELLSSLQQRDDAIFRQATNKAALEKYITSHPLDNTAKKYQLRHVLEAKKRIASIEDDSRRKKRKTIAIAASVIGVIAVIVCWLNYSPVKYINVNEAVSISKYGDSIHISAQTNVPSDLFKMEVESGSNWLKVSGEKGSYTLVVKPNPSSSRNATIKISVPNRLFGEIISWDSKKISISQLSGEPSYITPERGYMSFDKFGEPTEKSNLIITTDGVLESVASAPDWCNVSFAPIDNGRYECVVTMDKNNGERRSGQISIRGGDIVQDISIQQESGLASFISFNSGSISVSPREETKYIDIQTDGSSWSIMSTPSWIEATDNGNNTLKLVVAENENDKRSGRLTIKSNNGHTSSLSINQGTSRASYIRAGQTYIKAPTSGLDKYISVITDGKEWTVSDHPYWIDVTPYEDKLYVEVNSNSGKMRDGEIVLASNNGHRASISVKQDGEPTNFGASESTVYFSKEADSDYVTIYNNSNMSVSASSSNSWIDSYISGRKLHISCSSNKNSGRRSGTIAIRCGSQTKNITVKQNGYIPCPNPYCQGGHVWNDYFGWGPCMVCGTRGGQESKW